MCAGGKRFNTGVLLDQLPDVAVVREKDVGIFSVDSSLLPPLSVTWSAANRHNQVTAVSQV